MQAGGTTVGPGSGGASTSSAGGSGAGSAGSPSGNAGSGTSGGSAGSGASGSGTSGSGSSTGGAGAGICPLREVIPAARAACDECGCQSCGHHLAAADCRYEEEDNWCTETIDCVRRNGCVVSGAVCSGCLPDNLNPVTPEQLAGAMAAMPYLCCLGFVVPTAGLHPSITCDGQASPECSSVCTARFAPGECGENIMGTYAAGGPVGQCPAGQDMCFNGACCEGQCCCMPGLGACNCIPKDAVCCPTANGCYAGETCTGNECCQN